MLYGQEATDPDDATKQMLAFVCVNHKCDAHGEPVRAEDSCVFQKVYCGRGEPEGIQNARSEAWAMGQGW